MGRTATLTPEVEIESCPDYPRAFPFWNDVPILLLNHSKEKEKMVLFEVIWSLGATSNLTKFYFKVEVT